MRAFPNFQDQNSFFSDFFSPDCLGPELENQCMFSLRMRVPTPFYGKIGCVVSVCVPTLLENWVCVVVDFSLVFIKKCVNPLPQPLSL